MTKIKENFLKMLQQFEDNPRLFTILAFFFIYLVFFIKIDISPVFNNTILTGGDAASWHQVAKHLNSTLLPEGKLFGWNLAAYFGYNEFQFYFIIPFLIASLFSIIFPLAVALKITSVLGLFILPYAVYYAMKKITRTSWPAVAAAALSLLFIFNENYGVFGGNFISTLAGEFCYSHALSLLLFFIGRSYDAFKNNKSALPSGLLLGAIGLTHAFVFFIAIFIPFFFLFLYKDNIRRKLLPGETDQSFPAKYIPGKILITYLSGFLIMAFWAIPMLFTREFSQSIKLIWQYKNLIFLLGRTYFPLAIIAVSTGLWILYKSRINKTGIFLFVYLTIISYMMYFIARIIQIPDIRFIPFSIIFSIILFSLSLEHLSTLFPKKGHSFSLPRISMILIAIPILFFSLVPLQVTKKFKFKQSGYEKTPNYNLLKKLSTQLKGNMSNGRIFNENPVSRKYDFGSPRVFENLYLFTGRPGIEGIQYGSTHTARIACYMQSEYSPSANQTEQYRIYSKLNKEVLPLRFYRQNGSDVITHTPPAASLFVNNPDFYEKARAGKYRIFTFRHSPASYVHITDLSNISILKKEPAGWKHQFLRFFRNYKLHDRPFIPEESSGDLHTKLKIFTSFKKYENSFQHLQYNFHSWLSNYPYKKGVTSEKIDHLSISFTTRYPGKPHIISISYSPNFKSVNGEIIYPISPGFIMIIPKSSQVKISFERNEYEKTGLIISLFIIPLLIFRKKLYLLCIPLHQKISGLLIYLFIFSMSFLTIYSLFFTTNLSSEYQHALRQYHKKNYKKSLAICKKYTTPEKIDLYDSTIMLQLLNTRYLNLHKLGRYKEANALRTMYKKRFPLVRTTMY